MVWSLSKTGKVGVLLVYFLVLAASVSAAVYPGNTKPHAQASSDHTVHAPSETLAAVIEKQIEMKFDEDVPFKKTAVEDPSLPKGESYIRTAGVNGKRNVTYEVTYTDGVETDRKVLTEEVLQKLVDEIKVVGTKAAPEPGPQVQGTQTQKKEKTSTDDESSEPTPEPSQPVKGAWGQCYTSEHPFYHLVRDGRNNNYEEFSSLEECTASGRKEARR